jgi:predicted dehydrogenase
MEKEHHSRRGFVKAVTMGSIGMGLTGCAAQRRAVRVAIVGTGRRGRSLQRQVMALMQAGGEELRALNSPKVELVALCDVDPEHLERAAAAARKGLGRQPFLTTRFEELLEREDVEAVLIATPNHWHATQTLWACEAGKDVYVEKPACHTYKEAHLLRTLAANTRSMIQVGLQNRSDIGLKAAIAALKRGDLGKILTVRGLCYRERDSIGRRTTPLAPPQGLDYTQWLGPARHDPAALYREQFHYDWHWFWNTGGGELGNQGPHELDLIQWVVGDSTPPSEILSFGGRFAWDDAANTPNIHILRYRLGGLPVTFEIRDLWINPSTQTAPHFQGLRVGIIVECEGGQFRGGRGGGFFYDLAGTRITTFDGDAGADHLPNFLRAVRSRRRTDLAAPLLQAIPSTETLLLANALHRAAPPVSDTLLLTHIQDDPILLDAHRRATDHLAQWNIRTHTLAWQATPSVPFHSGQFHGPLAPAAHSFLAQPSSPQRQLPY